MCRTQSLSKWMWSMIIHFMKDYLDQRITFTLSRVEGGLSCLVIDARLSILGDFKPILSSLHEGGTSFAHAASLK